MQTHQHYSTNVLVMQWWKYSQDPVGRTQVITHCNLIRTCL